ncbi:MAG: FprA family A-type flavoprotein [Oscillospiraceae bacterium]
MSDVKISDSIVYVGASDRTIDLFESQYIVPNGMAYNSYVILDDKIAIMDTVDNRVADKWFENLDKTLNGRAPDYLVVQHMEPDHSSNILNLAKKYPDMKIVGNAKTFVMMGQFFDYNFDDRKVVVKEGDTLELGSHTLTFVMAPMVHWPEVMVTYESTEKVLFSADGFGKFGAMDADEDWDCEARRYYFNIVGKYGMQVQALLKKAAALDIKMILPLHGPILKDNLEHYIDRYNTWSSYTPEDKGVLVAFASIHGNTAKAAHKFGDMLKARGIEKVVVSDLSREDMAEVIEDAFRYDRMVVMSSSYDAGVFPVMQDFLLHLKAKAYQKRKVAIVENGSWAPSAGKTMKGIIETLKDIDLVDNIVTIKSTLKPDTEKQLEELADVMAAE